MNYQNFVDTVEMPCCVMSVEKTPAGTCGEIRIIAANKAYKNTMGPKYYDGMPYQELVPQDNKFEDYCFRAAILKQRMHAYVETKALHVWTDQTLIPLASDREELGYCQFIFEFTQDAEADRMAAISVTAAEAVIKASVTLLRAEDFQTSVRDVLQVIMEEADAIVKNRLGEINSCDIPYTDDLDAFNRAYLQRTAQAAGSCTDRDLSDECMVIGTSALVETELDGAVGMNSGIFNNPFLIWGRYRKKPLRRTLPVSFQFHHTQMDGAHAGRFLENLQREINCLR